MKEQNGRLSEVAKWCPRNSWPAVPLAATAVPAGPKDELQTYAE